MAYDSKKFLSEFSLTPQGTRTLESFFKSHYNDFVGMDKTQKSAAMKALKILLFDVLPNETKASLSDIFSDRSDHVIAINGLPESEGLEHSPNPQLQISITGIIGEAIFEMYGAQSTGLLPLLRKSGNTDFVGKEIHRDNHPFKIKNKKHLSEYLMLSVQFDHTQASTQLVNITGVLETIPVSMQKRINIMATKRIIDDLGDPAFESIPMKLSDLRKQMGRYPNALDEPYIRKIILISPPDSTEGKAFFDAVYQNSIYYNLKPGVLLILNQHSIWHQAQPGQITPVMPGKNVRLLTHHEGISAPTMR